MIDRDGLEQIMNFVGNRWVAEAGNPDSKPLQNLPTDFWMNSVGGKTAKGGFWVTTLMYTEKEADAEAFKQVLLRWQSRGETAEKGPDLIQIGKKKD